MSTNTATLKTFAQQTRSKLISLITTKLQFVLGQDTAELRGHEKELEVLRKEIQNKSEKNVIEEVAYTWFNRVMALRFMDANGYNTPMVVSPVAGQTRPEVLQDAMGGTFDENLSLSDEDKLLPEAKLYRRLLVAICNQKYTEMPFLFEHISDYTELLLPDDLLSDKSFVLDIRNGMTDEDCQNVEIMGWLYQFYIIDRKNDAEKKKTKKYGLKSDELAAATQLFTPHWIVRYMVENSLGRIWMTLHPESPLVKEMPYYISTPEGQTDTIPEDVKSVTDIRFIDPCMGSGHILVYAFDLFTKMYEEEGIQSREIPALILTNNIFGIDIDSRCYQLASFALTMKARSYNSRFLRKPILPNVIALQNIDKNTIESTGNWDKDSLVWQFENIDTIGSLLKITPEECSQIRVDNVLFGKQQKLMKNEAEYLSKKYHCVVTNPPYLGKGMGDKLKGYVQNEYPNSKSDTMATFMERTLEYCTINGKMAMINMQSWMFLPTYGSLRKDYIENYNIDSLLHLGPHAFDEIGGEVVQSVTFCLANHKPSNTANYYRLVDEANSSEKEQAFLNREHEYIGVSQNDFFKIPESPVGYWANETIYNAFQNSPSLGSMSTVKIGMGTGKNDMFLRNWWEISTEKLDRTLTNISQLESSTAKFFPYNKGGNFRKWYGNILQMLWFDEDGRALMNTMSGHRENGGYQYYCQQGITRSFIGTGSLSVRYVPTGCFFDVAGSTMFASGERLNYILGFLSTKACNTILKVLNPTFNFQAGNIKNLPLINKREEIINEVVKDNISISKSDWDSHEYSLDFKINEILRIAEGISYDQDGAQVNNNISQNLTLKDAVSVYETNWTEKFIQLHSNEEELNRQFIDIYGLQDELTPDVPLSDITILQKGEISIENNEIVWHEDVIMKQLISYLVGCFMGRYSIDKPGLIIASQQQDLSDLGLKVEGIENDLPGRLVIDSDGIIPIIEDEDFFADDMTQRLEQAIKVIFGEESYQQNLKYINSQLGKTLREYLFKDFYADHIDGKMYQKRPIYWLFSSKMGDKKKKGYFKALVYMHRIEPDTLSKLHADYVHPYLNKIERQLAEAEDQITRDDLTQAQRNKALKLEDEKRDKVREVHAFEQQLVEMASHRLSIDLDDGVKANYPKYYPLVEPVKGLDKEE